MVQQDHNYARLPKMDQGGHANRHGQTGVQVSLCYFQACVVLPPVQANAWNPKISPAYRYEADRRQTICLTCDKDLMPGCTFSPDPTPAIYNGHDVVQDLDVESS